MIHLIYKGKSNKKFTYNKKYKYYGSGLITVYSNRNQKININEFDMVDNWKFINDVEYRRLKLEKINKI